MSQLKLTYYNVTTGKYINYTEFSPFHEGYFEGVCIPIPGDILHGVSKKTYKVIRREFLMLNDTETSKDAYVKTVLILEEIEKLEEL